MKSYMPFRPMKRAEPGGDLVLEDAGREGHEFMDVVAGDPEAQLQGGQ